MAGSATRVDSVSCVCRVGASIASVATNACSARPPEASGERVSCAKDAARDDATDANAERRGAAHESVWLMAQKQELIADGVWQMEESR